MTMSPYGGRGFYDPHSEVNRLFDEMFGNLGSTSGRQQRTQQTQWAPALDVVQDGGDLLIRAELLRLHSHLPSVYRLVCEPLPRTPRPRAATSSRQRSGTTRPQTEWEMAEKRRNPCLRGFLSGTRKGPTSGWYV